MKIGSLFASFALLATLLAAPAHAESPGPATDDLTKIMNNLDVPRESQSELQELVHAQTSSSASRSASDEPILVAETSDALAYYSVFRQPDGTLSVTSLEKPTRTAETPYAETQARRGITGCTALSDSGGWKRRVNCTAKSGWSEVTGSFIFDYSVSATGGRVDDLGPAQMTAPGSDCTQTQYRITQRINEGPKPATARYALFCKPWYGGSYTAWMQVNVYIRAWVTDKTSS